MEDDGTRDKQEVNGNDLTETNVSNYQNSVIHSAPDFYGLVKAFLCFEIELN